MQMLKEGSQGSDVLSLQRKLAEKGFSPGALDGNFGPGTEAAVMAFQQGEGLLADGVVGAKTAAALATCAVPASSRPCIHHWSAWSRRSLKRACEPEPFARG